MTTKSSSYTLKEINVHVSRTLAKNDTLMAQYFK